MNTFRSKTTRARLLMASVILVLVVIAVTIAFSVYATSATSNRANKEATEAVLMAKMQASLQLIANERATTPQQSPSQNQLAAADEFRSDAAEFQSLVDADEQELISDLLVSFEMYLGSSSDDGSRPESSEDDRQLEASIREPLLAIQLEENEHLLESINAEAVSVSRLERLVPGLLVVGAFLSALAMISQARSERLGKLEEVQRAQDEFVASVSHELRTPLSAVLGLAAELRDRVTEFGTDEVAEMASIIAEQSGEISYLVEDLLVEARLDAGSLSVTPEVIELRSQLDSALLPFHGLLSSPCVVSGEAWAFADAGRVRQILRNLISNAIRHGGEHIKVAIESGSQEVLVTVKDDGEGLPPSEWEAIFEAYHRAQDVPGLPSSIGLGLTVSRRLAHQMGGTLDYRYKGGWSSFELTLPAVATPEPSMDVREVALSQL